MQLARTKNLYLVGHGTKHLIGMVGPTTVASAVANITPADWTGKIFSLNCWSGYRESAEKLSALDRLDEALATRERRNIHIAGPVGRSIRHKDWLGEQGSPFGMRAVVGDLDADEDVYQQILTASHLEGGIDETPEPAFDKAVRLKLGTGNIGVAVKAAFATEWGWTFQANVVKKLETDPRLTNAIAEKRMQFGVPGCTRRTDPSSDWGDRGDSNPRPSGPQPDALTT